MKGLDETRGTKFELVRHFLASMFDSEMFSTRGQWLTVAVSAFALAIPAGLLLLDPPYFHRPVDSTPETLRAVALADQLAMLTFVFAITGVLALLAWQSFFPTRRDHVALAGLPVRPWEIFAARFVSVALLAGAVTAAMCVLPTVLAPHQFTAASGTAAPALMKAAARAASAGAGCLFVFFAIVAIQGILINALPARLFVRFSTYVQGALVAACVLAGLSSWFIVNWRQEEIASLPHAGAWAPPVWFVGLHQVMLGDGDSFFAAMAARSLAAAAGSVAAAGLMYLLAYKRYRKLLLESPEMTAPRMAWKPSLLPLLTREPRQQAILQFMAHVFTRSRVHRLVLMAYAGAALALMVNSVLLAGAATKWAGGWRDVVRFVVLYWPVGFTLIVLAGVRHAFLMPVELRANWVFQITESQGRREWMAAVERFVAVCVIAPIHVVTLPAAAMALGWAVAARMIALQALVSLSAFELLFYSWQQLPFTCSYVPGKRPLVRLLACWIVVLGLLVPLLSKIIATMSQMMELFVAFLGIFLGVWLWARRWRREGWGESRLIYEDRNDAVADLGIREMSYHGTRFDRSEPAISVQAPQTAPASEAEGRSGRPVTVSLRLYRALANAFPHEFKNVYGEELSSVTEDAIEPVWRRHGIPGLARLLLDIAIRVPAEHAAELGQDVRYGLRMLARSPGFVAVALLSMSLGIGGGTAAFSFMNATILRNLPAVQNADELVSPRAPSSYPNYKRYRERHDLFSSTLAYRPAPFAVSDGGTTQRVWGHLVTPSYFSTLGVRPLMGRFFSEEQERPGETCVVVVSYPFWQNHMGSDLSAIGRTLRLNGHPCTVMGVGPEDFLGAAPMMFPAGLWMPLAAGAGIAPELADNALESRDAPMFQVVARLKPGVTTARAEAELDAVARQLERAFGDPGRDQKGRRVLLVTGGRLVPIRKENLPVLIASPLVLVGLMLLIACSNVANMMLARAAGRRREIAVRLALGASRARLIRQLMTESLLVACGAGAMGLVFTVWLMRLVSQPDVLRFSIRAAYPMPGSANLDPDWRVLLFTLVLVLFTGLAFGLAPAFQATRTDLAPALKEGGSVELKRFGRFSLRNLLVVSQVAGSLTLLVLTGILTLGYQRSTGMDVGFNTENLYAVSLDPIRDGYSGPQAVDFFQRLLDRVQRLPSVTAASLTDRAPMFSAPPAVSFTAAGAAGSLPVAGNADQFVVGKDYFETLGIPILLGRGFRREDEAGRAAGVIVSERVMRDFWNGERPVGRGIEIGGEVFELVGGARNTKMYFTPEPARPAIYFPLRPENYARPSLTGVSLLVRAAPGADAIGIVRREISGMDAGLTPLQAFSMVEQIARMMSVFRFGVWIHGFEGLFGLILASIGLAGMTAYSVARRGREIGIRMALGARSVDVLRLVMKEGAALVMAGTVLGLAGAWVGMRLLAGLISTVSSTAGASSRDPIILAGAPLLLAFVALAACFVPARKSTRIDPAVTLRGE